MAGKNVFNDKDSMDINELAALNEDISDDLLERLQMQVSASSEAFISNTDNDSASNSANVLEDALLFEEPIAPPIEPPQEVTPEENISTPEESINTPDEKVETDNQSQQSVKIDSAAIEENYNDNFIKKYKAKLQKQTMANSSEKNTAEDSTSAQQQKESDENSITELSKGNISEKEYTQEQKEYAESLDFLDGNVKYSKYVIYIEPENVDFIEGLTVKERKNLINGILKNQDDISNTKQRFKIVQTVINHVIVAILTISISIPIVYFVINASIEATVNNYRRSQTNFQTLYREKGKITNGY